MNLVLNTPITSLVPKQKYENVVLFVFLGLMFFMVTMGLLFIDLTKQFSDSQSNTIEKPTELPQQGRYV